MSSDTQDRDAKLCERLNDLARMMDSDDDNSDGWYNWPDLAREAADRITTLLSDLAQAQEVIAAVRAYCNACACDACGEILSLLPPEPEKAT